MKTVILCGGRGTRLGSHGERLPKALVEIGGQPIIWHLLKSYSVAGLNDFILCLGYLGDQIREYFEKTCGNDSRNIHKNNGGTVELDNESEGWHITLVETGLDTNTGARLKRAQMLLNGENTFGVTYGDGLADVDLKKLLDFHKNHGLIGTLTAVKPYSNFGVLEIDARDRVRMFREKPRTSQWINGGFFVFESQIFDYLDDESVLEETPLRRLVDEAQLAAFKHDGFWKCMDTYKDNLEFNEMWRGGQPSWKTW